MRLCYVGDLSNIHTRRWVRFFSEAGHQVHVISTKPADTTQLGEITVHWVLNHRSGNYLADLILGSACIPWQVRKMRQLFYEVRPEVVHVHYLNESLITALLTGYRPLVLTAWGSDILISPKHSWVRKQLVQYSLQRLDLMTCDADHVKAEMVSLGANPEKVKLVFFGTDVQRFSPARYNPILRKTLAPGDAPVVISTRKLEPLYDVETLIRAIPGVLAQFPTVRFWIAGSGPLEGSFRALAVELGVAENVQFLGALSEGELSAYLASSDIYVSTALSDAGIAASTAEAMACALPVVITDVAVNSQWVENGKQGLLVPPRDTQILAESLARLLAAPDLRKRMGQAARQVIEERNSLQQEMLKMEALYEDLVHSHTVRPSASLNSHMKAENRVEIVR